jgi:cytidylate kinase
LSDVATALAERDRIDSTRTVSPLAMAPDALHLETTGLSVEDVVSRVMAAVAGKSRTDRGRAGEQDRQGTGEKADV